MLSFDHPEGLSWCVVSTLGSTDFGSRPISAGVGKREGAAARGSHSGLWLVGGGGTPTLLVTSGFGKEVSCLCDPLLWEIYMFTYTYLSWFFRTMKTTYQSSGSKSWAKCLTGPEGIHCQFSLGRSKHASSCTEKNEGQYT